MVQAKKQFLCSVRFAGTKSLMVVETLVVEAVAAAHAGCYCNLLVSLMHVVD